MSWTFDPLQSLNTYFNLNKLGVVADRYLISFYGEDAASFLHRNSTRLWVAWPLTSDRVRQRLATSSVAPPLEGAFTLVELAEDSSPRSTH
jgi:chorismate synthase